MKKLILLATLFAAFTVNAAITIGEPEPVATPEQKVQAAQYVGCAVVANAARYNPGLRFLSK